MNEILHIRVLSDMIERIDDVRDLLEHADTCELPRSQTLTDNALREVADFLVELRAQRLVKND
jgi:hypothetical protein